MTSTFVKIASLGGGIATVTGGTIAVVYSLSDSSKTKSSTQSNGDESSKQQNTKQPQSITQLLTNNNLKLLSKSEPKDNDKWNTNWQKFQQANNSDTAPSVPWNFSDWKTTRVKTTAPEEFKTECEKHGAQTTINEQNSSYIVASTYCSKGIDE